MRVAVVSFGSNWWARSEAIPCRFARYNSTGIVCGRKIRRHWLVPGLARFNGVSNFSSWPPQRMLNHCFRCELSLAAGANRLLFLERVADSMTPEFYLVTISSASHGLLDLRSGICRSASSRIVAASWLREYQEIMLLIEPGGWFETSTGFWQLRDGPNPCRPQIVCLSARSGRLVAP